MHRRKIGAAYALDFGDQAHILIQTHISYRLVHYFNVYTDKFCALVSIL